MANQQGQAFEDLRNTISECLRILRQRWRLAAVGLCFVGSVAFWFSQYLPREYAAATIFERRDDVVLQNLIQGNSPYGFDHLKTTMTMDMTGSRAMTRALVTAGVLTEGDMTGGAVLTERERAALEAAVERYQLKTDVRLVQSSSSLDTIRLSCTANDPAVAGRVVVALRDGYIADTRGRIREILSGTHEFFGTEVARLQKQIAEGESSLRKELDEFPGLDPTDLAGVGHRLEMLRAQRDSLFQRKTALAADIAARETFLESSSLAPDAAAADTVAAGPAGDAALNEAIDKAQRDVVDLLTNKRMTLEHPAVKAARDRLAQLELLREAVGTAPGELGARPAVSEAERQWRLQRARVEMELGSLRNQSTVAEQQLTGADERLERFGQLYSRLLEQDGGGLHTMVDRRSEATHELNVWQGHLTSLERVLAAESGERGTQFTVLEEPEDVVRPSKPRVASVFVVCSGLALAAAALVVALTELFDRSFRSVVQVGRARGVPVLECIGVAPTPRVRRRATLSLLFWAPALSVLVLSLAVSAALAYASLALPGLHGRTMQRVEGALRTVGMVSRAPAGLLAARCPPCAR
jgi:hypothetical protein